MSKRKRLRELAAEVQRNYEHYEATLSDSQKEQVRRFYWFVFEAYEELVNRGIEASRAAHLANTKVYEWLELQGYTKETYPFHPVPPDLEKRKTKAFVKFTLSTEGPAWNWPEG